MTALMDLVIDCENRLGLAGPPGMPLYKARAAAIGQLRAGLRANPEYDIDDLRLALAWCSRRREPISSPLELFGKVKDAKEHAVVRERASDLTRQHQAALDWEMGHGDSASIVWITRLTRSVGPFRAEILDEWRAAGRGVSHGD